MLHWAKTLTINPYLAKIAQLLLVLLLLAATGLVLANQDGLPVLWTTFCRQLAGANLWWLGLCVLLMPLNWWTETQKWYPLVRKWEPMSQGKALRAVLAGVTVSLFTPNRVGAFGGRVLFVSARNRWHAFSAHLMGDFAQWIVLFAFGGLGAIALLSPWLQADPRCAQLLALLALCVVASMLMIYFNLRAVLGFVGSLTGLRPVKRFVKGAALLARFERHELLGVLGWAFVRYWIYATQYFFLLKFFDIKITLWEGYSGIFTLFLIQTSLPLPLLAGLLARGNLAMIVWKTVGANEVSSLAATFALWIINLILPALVGTFSILFVNIAKTVVHENDHH